MGRDAGLQAIEKAKLLEHRITQIQRIHTISLECIHLSLKEGVLDDDFTTSCGETEKIWGLSFPKEAHIYYQYRIHKTDIKSTTRQLRR